jgi:hypothetical protein
MKHFVACLVPLGCLSAPALAGPDWLEQGDAGSFLASAQAVVGLGTPQKISGSLSNGSAFTDGDGAPGGLTLPDFEDVYIIRIDQPATFSFTTSNASFDTQLFLFNITLGTQLFGLMANDSANLMTTSAQITTASTDGTGVKVANPGLYAIAVTGAGRYPTSLGGAIFNLAVPAEISGPDGPGGINAHNGWAGDGAVGDYEIDLEGIGYVDVPAPGAAGLLGAIALVASRRRRTGA